MNHATTFTVIVACIAASATIIAASIAALSAYPSGKRDRRRNLYSEAYRAALAWVETLYRVRRRVDGSGGHTTPGFEQRCIRSPDAVPRNPTKIN